MNVSRRTWLGRATRLLLGAGTGAATARSAQGAAPTVLRVATDQALVDSGFMPALQQAFLHDTGVPFRLVGGPASTMLSAIEQGEVEVAVLNAPAAEQVLDAKGLVHERTMLGSAAFLLVGPAMFAKALGAGRDVVLALSRLAQAKALFLSAGDGSGTHLLEQALWRAAAVAPQPDWYLQAASGRPLLAQIAERRACALVERGVWQAAAANREISVLVADDPRLTVPLHAMRSFRATHPAAKLLVQWLRSASGQRAIAARRGYLPLAR